jgi:hypothetical protein
MDKLTLESAIRNEAEQAIRDIARREAEEIKKLDDACAAETEEFRSRIQAQTDAKIRQESAKAENRSSLDLKKLKLKSVETFIHSAVEVATKTIRDSPDYKRFLLAAIGDAVSRISTAAEIRLKKEDLAFERDIREALKTPSKGIDIVIREDNAIKWGGCLITDVLGGRVFDSTIERIYFRKSLIIRREVIGLLGDMAEGSLKSARPETIR